MMRSDSGVRSTRAREVTISATYRPPAYSRHSLRNAELVIPAIGARITGVSTVMGPSFSGGSSSLGAGGVATTVTRPLSQSRANRAEPDDDGVQPRWAARLPRRVSAVGPESTPAVAVSPATAAA